MAYDETLAARIRRTLPVLPDITEKKTFGGLAFLLNGKMFCGIIKDELMARVGPDRHEASLGEPHVRPMDFAGRPMKGYVFVEPAGCGTDQQVQRWVKRSAEFVQTLDSEAPRKRKKVHQA